MPECQITAGGMKLESRKYCPVGGDLRKVAKTVKEASPEGPQGKRASMKLGAGASKV